MTKRMPWRFERRSPAATADMLSNLLPMSDALRCLTLTVLALVVCALGACADSEPAGGSRGLGLNVQSAWQRARTTSGHQVHVAEHHVRCAQCHELDSAAVGKVSPERCGTCHERESRIRHAAPLAAQRLGAGATADCTTCHAFTMAAAERTSLLQAESSPADCARCHAVRQGSTPAVVVHGSSRCVSCHRPHQDATPEPGRCASCHHDIATQHAAVGKSPQHVCTTCHQHQHAPAAEALATCQGCHAAERPIVPASALFAGGHSECVGCHRPHEFEKKAAQDCRSCHTGVVVLARARVTAHAQCTNCHAPHDVRESPQQACAKCHSALHPEHPRIGESSCTGCHDPHPPSSPKPASVRSCSSCHQTAHTDKEFHGGVACTQCHKPHAFALAKDERTLCSDCHAPELARVATRSGHENCAGCHRGLPHKPSTLLAGCETCHASESHQARVGHQQCTNCHEPHDGTRKATCQGCHQAEAHSAPRGHAECVKCHQPHSGATGAVACSSCHAQQASSKHGLGAGGCDKCHRPHGPQGLATPPTCESCHQVTSLLGLHQVGKHQDCARCHTGHGEERAGLSRDVCLTCHADRKSHFPDAPRCANCHLFDAPSKR